MLSGRGFRVQDKAARNKMQPRLRQPAVHVQVLRVHMPAVQWLG